MYEDQEYRDLNPAENSQNTPARPAKSARYDYTAAPVKKKSGGVGRWIALTVCCSLLSGALGAGAVLSSYKPQKPISNQPVSNILEGNRESAILQINQIDTGKLMTPAEVYATNVQSTVGITTAVTTNYWGFQTTSAASGSGFILSDDGYVLTNYHVVENSSSISVAMYDGRSFDAELIGYDESNDIAVLKIEAEGLTPVILGDSDNLNVGDYVVAIGNPLGELTFSLTSGTISALERQITMSSGTTMNLMQTDCAINSGNSGGALFNLYGEVIGITNAKYSGSGSSSEASIDNIGFAIPMNQARKIFESIIEKGYYSKPYIGVSVSDVSTESQSYGLPQGAAVREVDPQGPAAAAGLQKNDIITSVNGTALAGSQDLITVISACAPGDSLQLQVYRQGTTIELTITVGEQINSTTSQQQQQQQQQNPQYYPNWGNRR